MQVEPCSRSGVSVNVSEQIQMQMQSKEHLSLPNKAFGLFGMEETQSGPAGSCWCDVASVTYWPPRAGDLFSPVLDLSFLSCEHSAMDYCLCWSTAISGIICRTSKNKKVIQIFKKHWFIVLLWKIDAQWAGCSQCMWSDFWKSAS